jgi:hypothetical protein
MLGGMTMSSCQAMGMDDGEAFIDACGRGSLNDVRTLIDRVDINTRNWRGETGLMRAVLYGKKDIVDYLLNHGADPIRENEKYKTALYYALQSDAPEAVQAEIVTMIITAAENMLLHRAEKDRYKMTLANAIVDALAEAVEKKKFGIGKILLSKKPEDINAFKSFAQRVDVEPSNVIALRANFLLNLHNALLRIPETPVETCTICCEDNSFNTGKTIVVLGCGHYFCAKCIDAWIAAAQKKPGQQNYDVPKQSCPMCKNEINKRSFSFVLQEVPNLQEFLQQAAVPAEEKKPAMPDQEKKSAPFVEEKKEEAGVWACPRCTFLNPEQYLTCGVCGESRLLQPRLNEWKCSVCPLMNLPENVVCSACGVLRVVTPVMVPPAPMPLPVPQPIPPAAPFVHVLQPAPQPAHPIDIVKLQKTQQQELQRGVARDVWLDMKMHRDRRFVDIFNQHWSAVFCKK